MESGKNIMRFLEFYMISFLYLIFVLWFTGLYQVFILAKKRKVRNRLKRT